MLPGHCGSFGSDSGQRVLITVTILLIVVIVAACGYSWLNGFHDASNSIAASVKTHALTPRVALVLVSICTAFGTIAGGLMGSRLITRAPEFPHGIDGLAALLCALIAAGLWSLWTWWRKVPSSSTQALLAGILGALTASVMTGHYNPEDLVPYALLGIVVPLVVTPIASVLLATIVFVPVSWLMRHRTDNEASATGRIVQSITTALLAFAHGMQDGQRNALTIVIALSIAGHASRNDFVLWVQVLVALLMAFGILCGGWRITHTLSSKLARITPIIGATSHASSALLLYIGSFALHMPISSTQSVTSAIVGTSLINRRAYVQWPTVLRIARYWLATPVICTLASLILFLAISPLLPKH